MRDLEKDYQALEEKRTIIFEAFCAHEKEEEKEKRKEWRVLKAQMEEEGDAYMLVFQFYEKGRQYGNPRLDIYDLNGTQDVRYLVAAFRKYGVKEFTMSSDWKMAIGVAWEFVQNGCEVIGMVEVQSAREEKKPAYLFRVQEEEVAGADSFR